MTDGLWDGNLIRKSICACMTPIFLFLPKSWTLFLPNYHPCRIKNERLKQPISAHVGDISTTHIYVHYHSFFNLRNCKWEPWTSDEDSHSWLLFALEYVGARFAKARYYQDVYDWMSQFNKQSGSWFIQVEKKNFCNTLLSLLTHSALDHIKMWSDAIILD